MDFHDRLKWRLLGTSRPHGCTVAEIEQLERRYGVELPQAYVSFLRQAGRGAQGLWTGSDFDYAILADLQEWATELLREQSAAPLPAGAFVFYMHHQGYQFFYFLNQEVWYYRERMPQGEWRFSSFEGFFDSFVD